MEIPSASSFPSPRLKGFLNKLTGRGWLYSGTWKKRYCVLDGTKLYFYESEDSKGSERSAGVINLDYYDLCEEGGSKDSKRASNVFVIGTSVRGFFDNRHLFSAETPAQMEEWIHDVRDAINDARNNRCRAGRVRSNDKKLPDCSNLEGSKGTEAKFGRDAPRAQSPDHLYHATKHRTRGPRGRRLPKRKTMMSELMLQDSDDLRPRSTSLSALERVMEEDDEENDRWLSVSMEAVDEPTRSPYDSAENGFVEGFRTSASSDEFYTARSTEKDHARVLGQNAKQFEARRAALLLELEGRCGVSGGDKKRPVSMIPSSAAKSRQNQTTQNSKDTHISSMAVLHNRIDKVESDVSAVKKDVTSVQDSLSNVKSNMRLLSYKIESLEENVPFQNLEQQLTSRLTEMQAMCEEARRVLKEAQQARDEHVNLAKECQEVLSKFKIVGKKSATSPTLEYDTGES